MDCREVETLLTAFHDGELPDAGRIRVEDHLRGCPECERLLADLARADEAADVPDPGPVYWDRFNVRVTDRIEREAKGAGVSVVRSKPGWMRQQLRFLVPAAAAAALVVAIVRFGGLDPSAPKPPLPPAGTVQERSEADSVSRLMEKEGTYPAAARKEKEDAVSRPLPAESDRAAQAPAVPPPAIARDRIPAVTREERKGLTDRLRSDEQGRSMRDRADAPAGVDAPSSPPPSTYRSAPAGPTPAPATDGRPSMEEGGKNMAGAAPKAMEPHIAAREETDSRKKIERAAPPCETARTMAAKGRFREAEAAQRECLAQDPAPITQEKGLVFLAELLDRQARFAEADEVLSEVHRQFPESLPLTLYRQQRPMVQKQQIPAPVTR